MTDDAHYLAACFAVGVVFGALYFVALWAVVQRLRDARRPVLLLVGSTVFRLALLFVAWLWVSDGRWDGLIACVVGFLLVRFGAIHLVRLGSQRSPTP